MPIPVFEELRQWLQNKGLQGYLKIAYSELHPHAAQIIQQIDITRITNKQVRRLLNLKREGFNVMQKLYLDVLRSYFGAYSPSAKAYQTQGGEDEFFHEVVKFLLEVSFLSPRFYCMPKKTAGFIISTCEGEMLRGHPQPQDQNNRH